MGVRLRRILLELWTFLLHIIEAETTGPTPDVRRKTRGLSPSIEAEIIRTGRQFRKALEKGSRPVTPGQRVDTHSRWNRSQKGRT